MNDDDTQYGAYTPAPEDYNTFDAREDEQDRGWLLLAASAVVFVLFVAVVYNTFQLGVRERGESPVIMADAEPYRVAPEDPGGYEAPDQDLSAYGLREGEATAASDTDPVTAPARDVQEEPISPSEAERETPRELPALQVETANADQLNEPVDASPAPQTRRSDPEPQAETETPAPELRQPDPTPPPAATPAPSQPAAQSDGAFVAQIAAFRSREDAEAGWIAFTTRFSDITVGYAPDIQRADLGDRGVFHRLRVAAFPTRQAALDFCAQLDARGQACMVRTR